MTPGTLVLLHTPHANAGSWGDLPEMLRSYGFDVVTPDVPDLEGVGYVARASLIIAATAPEVPLVLVGHGAAGPLLPAIAAAQRAAHRPVGAYVFVDASLPRPLRANQNHEHEHTHDEAAQPSRIHEHGVERPSPVHGREAEQSSHAREAGQPSLAHALAQGRHSASAGARGAGGAEVPGDARGSGDAQDAAPSSPPAPVPADWPDAPCGYLRTHADRTAAPPGDGADDRAQAVREATLRGWTVVQHEPPAAVAQTLSELIATL